MSAWAQERPAEGFQPDVAGEVLRQQERLRVLRERYERGRAVHLGAASSVQTGRLPVGERGCVLVKQIVFEGRPPRRFRRALRAADVKGDRARGRCLGRAGFEVVRLRVQQALMARGYVTTQVQSPEQVLGDGVLRLTLVPGRLGGVRFGAGGQGMRWHNALPARPGDVLNLRDAEQALENFQRVPTVEVTLRFETPEAAESLEDGFHVSDLVIERRQGARVQSRLWLDDGGGAAFGGWQGGVLALLNNALGWNESGYVHVGRSLLNGRGGRTRSWGVHAGVPVGYWKVGAHVGGDEWQQPVAGAFERYIYSGTQRSGEVRVGRVLWRGARSKTGAWLRGWWQGSGTAVDGEQIEVQRRRTGGWEAGLLQRRAWGDVTLEAGLSYRRGTGAFGALRAPEEAFAEGTSRSQRVLADARVGMPLQVGGWSLRYHAQWRGQWNRTALTAQERFGIGGRYSVRGFDDDAMLTGERGWWLRNEWGVPFKPRYEAYLGVDYGRVGGRSQGAQADHALSGLVVGLRGCSASIQWELFAGRPLMRPDSRPEAGAVYGVSLSSGC